MTVVSKPMTAEELLALPDDGGHRFELVKGELRTMSPSGARHGRIAAELVRLIGNFVAENRLGRMFTAEGGFLIARDPDTVRAPDVAFVRRERLVDVTAYFPGAPDLAVEVVSPSDRYTGVEAKVREWLAAGTQTVIIIDPETRTAQVRTSSSSRSLTVDDALDAGEVLPGWTLPMRALFE